MTEGVRNANINFMKKDDIQHLANLSRLELSDEELEKYAGEFGEILHYVGKISEISQKSQVKSEDLKIESAMTKNVFREDDDVQEGGKFTKEILEEAPDKQDDFVKVKKILNNES
jgi:aspartyl-tRNA(Asn)/glutamyl-tRNA(Gln) amidotransferase subunit C